MWLVILPGFFLAFWLEYYGSTLFHIMNPEAPICPREDILEGIVMPPDDLDVGVL